MTAEHRMPLQKVAFPTHEQARPTEPSHAAGPFASRGSIKRFLAGFFFVVLCLAIAWPLLPRRYESTASVILRPTDAQGRLDSGQSLRQPLDDNAIQSEMDIIGSPTIASAVIAQHGLASDPEFAGDPDRLSVQLKRALYSVAPIASEWFGDVRPVSDAALREELQKHLNVSRDRRSYTVKMGYWSADPAKAAALTDTLLNAYLSDQLSRKRGSAEQHSEWLIERVERLRNKYDASQRAIREFSLAAAQGDASMLASLESQRASLNQELSDLRGKIAAAALKGELPLAQRGRSSSAGGPSPAGSITPAQAQSTDIQAWEQRSALIEKTLRTVREEIADRRLAALKLEALEREAAIDKDLLDGALLRLKEQEPRNASVGPGVEILARPDAALRPSFPNALLFLIGTLVAAIAAGLAAAWNPGSSDARRRPRL